MALSSEAENMIKHKPIVTRSIGLCFFVAKYFQDAIETVRIAREVQVSKGYSLKIIAIESNRIKLKVTREYSYLTETSTLDSNSKCFDQLRKIKCSLDLETPRRMLRYSYTFFQEPR
jgi:hypothetical protein